MLEDDRYKINALITWRDSADEYITGIEIAINSWTIGEEIQTYRFGRGSPASRKTYILKDPRFPSNSGYSWEFASFHSFVDSETKMLVGLAPISFNPACETSA